ncbi:MAG: hypothetical protein K1X67_01570 [Fimbriimonadaceae bacterium]|nr:hypothetical protein [Fimbriimonadaceae bacterium]
MKIVVEIHGGCLVAVHSDLEAEVVLVDWDDQDEEQSNYRTFPFRANRIADMDSETRLVVGNLV